MGFDYEKFCALVEDHADSHVKALGEWIKIDSISGNRIYHPKCHQMVVEAQEKLNSLGFSCRVVPNPVIEEDGHVLPPILLAERIVDPKYKTICIYGHLDVQPAKQSDGWSSDPFVLTERDEKLFGRGATDDKGPVVAWIIALEILKKLDHTPAINLKICFEAMEEVGSIGLHEIIEQEKEGFFKGVEYVCISDNYWVGCEKPCITYGTRGNVSGMIKISGPAQDLHSGSFGGAVYEPLSDLVHLMSRLVPIDAAIPPIPALMDDVVAPDQREIDFTEKIDFDIEEFKQCMGVQRLKHQDKKSILFSRWRYPVLSLHGIEGAYSEPGMKTVIPGSVIGKFSIRMVPNMEVEKTITAVKKFLVDEFAACKSPNVMTIEMEGSAAWLVDTSSPNMKAAASAIEEVYKITPDYTREGGSLPIAPTFTNILDTDLILLPIGCGDDGAHSQNEKINRKNFLSGIKLFACYIENLSQT